MDPMGYLLWLQEKLLPSIPAGFAIMMNDALYHSAHVDKVLTSADREDELVAVPQHFLYY
jgi:hypothetical protein